MKRTILVVIMALVFATPCFAQEIETDGLFSIDGTKWRMCGIVLQTPEQPIVSFKCDYELAFYHGSVFQCLSTSRNCTEYPNDRYIDTPVVSVAWHKCGGCGFASGKPHCNLHYQVGTIQPLGLGLYTDTS